MVGEILRVGLENLEKINRSVFEKGELLFVVE